MLSSYKMTYFDLLWGSGVWVASMICKLPSLQGGREGYTAQLWIPTEDRWQPVYLYQLRDIEVHLYSLASLELAT